MLESPTYVLSGVLKAPSDSLEDFVGPLDVILHLLSKNKIEIKNIQISVILEQYLSYLDKMKKMDLEIASEFISMASYLLYLKTKKLLLIDEEEADAEMELLIKTLEERRRSEDYRKIKYAGEILLMRSEIGRNLVTRPALRLAQENLYPHTHTKDELLIAIKDIILRSERRLPPPITAFTGLLGKEPYPVNEKVKYILERLSSGAKRFLSIITGVASRSEIVATFLAVLELCKDRSVRLDGPEYDYMLSINEKEDEF